MDFRVLKHCLFAIWVRSSKSKLTERQASPGILLSFADCQVRAYGMLLASSPAISFSMGTFQFSQVSSIVSRSAAVASSASQSYATILVPAATARNTNSAAANPPCNDRRKKASSEKRKNDRFVEPDVFRPGTVGGWGEIAKPPACMQKPRSTNWPNGRCVRGKPGLARAAATAIENQKPFDLSWQQGGSWQNCEVCQAVRNYTRGRASNASRQWPRRPDC